VLGVTDGVGGAVGAGHADSEQSARDKRERRIDRRAVSEALPRRGVEVPDHVIDVCIGVVRERGLARKVSAEQAIRILDRASLPGAVWVAEVGVQADCAGDGLVPRELAAVVVGDGAAGGGGQSAQFCDDGLLR